MRKMPQNHIEKANKPILVEFCTDRLLNYLTAHGVATWKCTKLYCHCKDIKWTDAELTSKVLLFFVSCACHYFVVQSSARGCSSSTPPSYLLHVLGAFMNEHNVSESNQWIKASIQGGLLVELVTLLNLITVISTTTQQAL